MFIAHLPAAYLAFKTAAPRLDRIALAAGLAGSVFPDIDLLRFYLIDARSVHHHEYLTHRPAVWAVVALVGLLTLRFRKLRIGGVVSCFAIGALIHMALDSITGSIAWGWPVSAASHPLVTVPRTHDNWILSFLTHWTFRVELGIVLLAGIVAFAAHRKRKNPAHRGRVSG